MGRRGRWAEKAVASFFRKIGCSAITNVYDVKEIDVLGICLRSNILVVYIVEVKSGRQLIGTPVLRRLRYILTRVSSRKTPLVKVCGGKVSVIEYVPMLVIGPGCALTPKAEEYAIKYKIAVYRYTTAPVFSLNRVI